MNKLILLQFIWLSAAMIIGCAGGPRTVDWSEVRPLGRELPSCHARQKPKHHDIERAYIEPEWDLTLRKAFAAALLNDPKLATVMWEVRTREARDLQASLLPNPEIEFEMEDFGGTCDTTAFDSVETTVLFSQLIELGQKRQERTRLAELNQDLGAWDYETVRVDVLTSVARVFTNTGYTQGNVGYLEVLEAQWTFFEARGRVVGSFGAYHRAVVDVKGLIGRPLSAFDTPNESHPNVHLEDKSSTGDQP